jgi:hypothetical protein
VSCTIFTCKQLPGRHTMPSDFAQYLRQDLRDVLQPLPLPAQRVTQRLEVLRAAAQVGVSVHVLGKVLLCLHTQWW